MCTTDKVTISNDDSLEGLERFMLKIESQGFIYNVGILSPASVLTDDDKGGMLYTLLQSYIAVA